MVVRHLGVGEGKGQKVRGQPSLASEESKHIRKEVRKGGGRGEREEGRMKDEQKDVTVRGVSYAPERHQHVASLPVCTTLCAKSGIAGFRPPSTT